VLTTDGRSLHLFVEHAIGSLERPMSEAQLKAKFIDQSAPVIGAERANQAWLVARNLAQQADLTPLLAAATQS
jgi:hypothetical protein